MSIHTIRVNQLFKKFIGGSDIEIHFEEKNMLTKNEKVINLSINPIRFADDIFLNFETNCSVIKEKLKTYEVNYNIFFTYADIIKATCAKNIKKNKAKENTLLIIGQTEKDKALLDDNKYVTLIDFIDNLNELSKKYANICFKPHPYAQNNKEIFKELKKRIKNISISYNNIYQLLSDNNIKCLAGLNSSTLYEAKYFGKEAEFLYRSYFDLESKDIGIFSDYFNSSFWATILESEDAQISLPFVQNRLRKIFDEFWSYNAVSEEIILKNIFRNKLKYFRNKFFNRNFIL